MDSRQYGICVLRGLMSLSDTRGHRLARCRLIRIPVKSRYAERGVSDMHVTSAKRCEIWLLCSQIIFAWLKVINEIHMNTVSRWRTVNISNLTIWAILPETLPEINHTLKLIAPPFLPLMACALSAKIEIKALIPIDLH